VWTSGAGPAEPVRQAAVRDAAPVAGAGPFLLFAHGFAGFRREATYLPAHLASHGYVVAGADHLGSTSWDVDDELAGAAAMTAELVDPRARMAQDRKDDVVFLVAEATRRGFAPGDEVGVTGISLGGFTCLVAPAVEPRVRAIAAMCPAGGPGPIAPPDDALTAALDFGWPHEVATLQMVAEHDTWVPLYGQLDLFARVPGHPRLVVLRDADHNHFVDDVETSHGWYIEITRELAKADPAGPWSRLADRITPYADLVPGEAVYPLWRGLTVAHFDAHLRGTDEGRRFLDGDLGTAARRLGAEIVTVTR
jgi:dienelactone hydrolase